MWRHKNCKIANFTDLKKVIYFPKSVFLVQLVHWMYPCCLTKTEWTLSYIKFSLMKESIAFHEGIRRNLASRLRPWPAGRPCERSVGNGMNVTSMDGTSLKWLIKYLLWQPDIEPTMEWLVDMEVMNLKPPMRLSISEVDLKPWI